MPYIWTEMCIGRDSHLGSFVLPAPGLPELTGLTCGSHPPGPTCADPEAEASTGQFTRVWSGGRLLRGGATRSVVYFRCHTAQISERNCDQIIRLLIDSYRITSHEVANRLHHEAESKGDRQEWLCSLGACVVVVSSGCLAWSCRLPGIF